MTTTSPGTRTGETGAGRKTMSESRLVHVKDNIDGAVYIGRSNRRYHLSDSRWANPYVIGVDGDRSNVIRLYRNYLGWFPRNPTNNLMQHLPELRGKVLACWCRHDGQPLTGGNACHGDVLLALLDQYTDDELREMGR